MKTDAYDPNDFLNYVSTLLGEVDDTVSCIFQCDGEKHFPGAVAGLNTTLRAIKDKVEAEIVANFARAKQQTATTAPSQAKPPALARVLADALTFDARDRSVIEVYLRGSRAGLDLDIGSVRETSDDVLREVALGRKP